MDQIYLDRLDWNIWFCKITECVSYLTINWAKWVTLLSNLLIADLHEIQSAYSYSGQP